MFFNVQDVEQFLGQKDFIDTAIVPLLALDFAPDKIKQSSSAAEFLMALTAFIEQQFKGRLMVLPPFSYMANAKQEELLNTISTDLSNAGFKHVFFITCDASWTSLKEDMNVIWLPSIPLESMDKSVKKTILEDQLRQVIPILSAKWAQTL